MRLSSREGRISSYLSRPPERLVLEGYRRWAKGYELRSCRPWHEVAALYAAMLGRERGRDAIAALGDFVATLGLCATCPLRMLRANTPALCRDESLVIGLVAGFQWDDGECLQLCLGALCCPMMRDPVSRAAGGFARTLKSMDQVLLPVPASAVVDVLDRSQHAVPEPSDGSGPTLH